MFRKHLVLFLLILFAGVVVILPQPAYAFDTYLPSLRRPLRDEDLPGYNPMPPATPTPIITLRDGDYSSGNANVDISFRVTNSGSTADFASFRVKSSDPLQFYCADGFGYFSDSVSASNQKFAWTSLTMLDYARLNAKGTTMKCSVLSETQAECSVYDPWAARSTLALGCGAATATVTWQN
jgi:hypothetical protein